MIYPSLVYYQTIAEYRSHYKRVYCQKPIRTFDGIAVRFRNDIFDHCFFESTQRNQVKDVFSNTRAKRIDWIKAALGLGPNFAHNLLRNRIDTFLIQP